MQLNIDLTRVAGAVGDANILIESAIALALAISWGASDGAIVSIVSARVSALSRDFAVVFEAISIGIGKVGAVGVSKNVVRWASATVGAVSVARTLG